MNNLALGICQRPTTSILVTVTLRVTIVHMSIWDNNGLISAFVQASRQDQKLTQRSLSRFLKVAYPLTDRLAARLEYDEGPLEPLMCVLCRMLAW